MAKDAVCDELQDFFARPIPATQFAIRLGRHWLALVLA